LIRIANQYKNKFLTTGIKIFNYKCGKIPNVKSKSSFKVNAVICFQPTDKEYTLANVVIALVFKKLIMTPDGITFLMKKVVFSHHLLETIKMLT
jgi:hypothetical protein